jgi:hypothetical protein
LNRPLDIEVSLQQFDIGEEMSCRVRGEKERAMRRRQLKARLYANG